MRNARARVVGVGRSTVPATVRSCYVLAICYLLFAITTDTYLPRQRDLNNATTIELLKFMSV